MQGSLAVRFCLFLKNRLRLFKALESTGKLMNLLSGVNRAVPLLFLIVGAN